MRTLFDPPESIVLEKLLLVRRMTQAVERSRPNVPCPRPRTHRAIRNVPRLDKQPIRTLAEYHEYEVLPRMRRKAAELIQANMGLLIKLMHRNFQHAIQAAVELGRVNGDAKELKMLAVYDAFPQLLNAAMKFLRVGESKGNVVCTYLGWGLRAWASSVFDEKRQQLRAAGEDEAKLQCVECHRAVTYAEREIEQFRSILTERELFVLAKLADGYTLIEIAGKRSRLKEIQKIKARAFKKIRKSLGDLQS